MSGFRGPKVFSALIALVVLTGALVTVGSVPAGAGPSDRWIDVAWSCCGDQFSAVSMGGAWASGMPVTLEIDRGNNGSIDATQTGTTPIVNNFFSITPKLAPGDRVKVTSDGVIKETVVADLSVEYVNPVTNVVQGRSTPGSTVAVTANPGPGGVDLPATANGAGHWSVDFTGFFDIQEHDPSGPASQDELVSARLVETGIGADGDATNDGRSAEMAKITVLPNCCGNQAIVQNPSQGWRVGTQLTLDVDRGNNGSVDFTKTLTYTGFPGLTGSNELAPLAVGDKVTVSGAGWVKVLIVAPVSITGINAATNVVTGTATFNDDVGVDIINPGVPGPNPATRSVHVSDPGGSWSVDFSPFDVTPTQQAQAYLADADQDRTGALYFPVPPSPALTPSPDTGLVNGQSISLTGANWPAGKTLFVTECRLDQGLSPSSCDANTAQQYTVLGDGTVSGSYVVTRNIVPSSGTYDCLVTPGCGLVGVVWPGAQGQGNPQALDFPGNNPIAFVAPNSAPTRVTATTPGPGSRATMVNAVPPPGPTPNGYQVRCMPVGVPFNTGPSAVVMYVGTPTFPVAVDGLARGKTYHCKVRARYGPDLRGWGGDAYEGPLSDWSNTFVVPVVKPDAPRQVTVTPPALPSGQSAKVMWTDPPNNSGVSPITDSVQCTSSNGGVTRTPSGTTSPQTVTGLSKGATYVCSVRSTNTVGSSAWTSSAPFVVPPAAPTNVHATAPTAVGRSTSVSFTPGPGGPPVTTWRARCTRSDGGATLTGTNPVSPIVVTNLVHAKTYRCTVNAMYGATPGEASAPSNAITVP